MWDRSNNSEKKQANQPGQRGALFIGIDEVALAKSSSIYYQLGYRTSIMISGRRQLRLPVFGKKIRS